MINFLRIDIDKIQLANSVASLPVTPALHVTSDLLVQSHITHDMSRGVTRRRVMPGQPGLHNNLQGREHDLKNHFS